MPFNWLDAHFTIIIRCCLSIIIICTIDYLQELNVRKISYIIYLSVLSASTWGFQFRKAFNFARQQRQFRASWQSLKSLSPPPHPLLPPPWLVVSSGQLWKDTSPCFTCRQCKFHKCQAWFVAYEGIGQAKGGKGVNYWGEFLRFSSLIYDY